MNNTDFQEEKEKCVLSQIKTELSLKAKNDHTEAIVLGKIHERTRFTGEECASKREILNMRWIYSIKEDLGLYVERLGRIFWKSLIYQATVCWK